VGTFVAGPGISLHSGGQPALYTDLVDDQTRATEHFQISGELSISMMRELKQKETS